jgi:hypothetical protein
MFSGNKEKISCSIRLEIVSRQIKLFSEICRHYILLAV